MRVNILLLLLVWRNPTSANAAAVINGCSFIAGGGHTSARKRKNGDGRQYYGSSTTTAAFSKVQSIHSTTILRSRPRCTDGSNNIIRKSRSSSTVSALYNSANDGDSDGSKGLLELSDDDTNNGQVAAASGRRERLRKRVSAFAQKLVVKPITSSRPEPQAIASILKESTLQVVDLAVDEVASRVEGIGNDNYNTIDSIALSNNVEDTKLLIDKAFEPMEKSIIAMEISLLAAKKSLELAKEQATQAVESVQVAAMAQAEGARSAVVKAEEVAERKLLSDIYTGEEIDLSSLSYDDIDYRDSEMDPPFLDENSCLIPGEPVVRVERAPENSRRIFAGVDIMADADDVWKVLTDYENLQNVVPNLVVNKVLEEYPLTPKNEVAIDSTKSENDQCIDMSKQMKGALLKQVGGAKVAGIRFSARTTLEVREWPQGMPDFAHLTDEMYEGVSRDARAADNVNNNLKRYLFPRPFALSSLPTKDISMQSIEKDDGEFRLYQGVWRMQPLVGCAAPGKKAMRLSYAVEISPRAYLPVQLIEKRIVKDLCTNLLSVRDYVQSKS